MIIEGRPKENGPKRPFIGPGASRPGPAGVFCSLPQYARILGIAYGDDTNTMGQRAYPRSLAFALLAAAALAWLAPSAQAANVDYCVTCKSPDEVYRCRVTGVDARVGDALKLYCVIRLAKEGNHASCAAEAATTSCVGLVKVYNYDGPALPDNLTADPRVRKLQQKVERNQRDFAQPEGNEPKSLFELGGRAVSASKKGLRNAGSAIGLTSSDSEAARPAAQPLPRTSSTSALPTQPAPRTAAPPPTETVGTATRVKQAAKSASSAVGGFARKSYHCMLSLFRHCSEEESGALE